MTNRFPRVTASFGLAIFILIPVFSVGDSAAATLTVVNTLDSGAGSLRQAVLDAAASAGPDTIEFDIPGPGPHTIQTLSPITVQQSELTIDATTQSGYAGVPAVALGPGGQLEIAFGESVTVKGLGFGGEGGGVTLFDSALVFIEDCAFYQCGAAVYANFSDFCAVRNNLMVQCKTGAALMADNTAFVIEENVIRNGIIGILLSQNNNGHLIQKNRVNGHSAQGIFLDFANTGNEIEKNLVLNNGTGAHIGKFCDGNRISLNTIGRNDGAGIYATACEDLTAEKNILFSNGWFGVAVEDQLGGQFAAAKGVTLTQNAFFGNGKLGINLFNRYTPSDDIPGSGNGVDPPNFITPNDWLDADSGANNLQNHPAITGGAWNALGVSLSGRLDSRPSREYAIELYANPAPHPSGAGEGFQYLGTVTVTTDSDGRAPFAFQSANADPAGPHFTALAIDAESGDTSEFGPALYAPFDGDYEAYRVEWPGTNAYFNATLSMKGKVYEGPAWCADLDHLIGIGTWYDGSAPDRPAPVLYSTLPDEIVPGLVDNPENLRAVNFLLNALRGAPGAFQARYPGATSKEVEAAIWKLLFQGVANVQSPAGFIQWNGAIADAIYQDALAFTPSNFSPGKGGVVAVIVYLGDGIQTTLLELPHGIYKALRKDGCVVTRDS